MLVRLFPDVINLKPAAMIVLDGTNDIARNTGPITQTMITQNVQAMTELTQLHGIKVILCSVLPISDYTARPNRQTSPPIPSNSIPDLSITPTTTRCSPTKMAG